MKRFIINLCLFLSATSLWGQLEADQIPVTKTFVLTHVNIVSKPGQILKNQEILIQDGLILSIGASVKAPATAQRISADSMYLYAGFIEALSYTGLKPVEDPAAGRQAGRPGGGGGAPANLTPPSLLTNEMMGASPEVKVKSLINAKEASIEDMRKLGFTAGHIVPRGKMLPGSGAILIYNGDHTDRMLVKEDASMYSQLIGAGQNYPNTVMGVMSKWRELYKNGETAKFHEKIYQSNPVGVPRPDYDAAVKAFYPVIDKSQTVFFRAEDYLTALRALKLKQDLGFPIVLSELREGWDLADKIKAQNIPVLLSLNFPKEIKEEKKDTAKSKMPLTPMEAEEKDLLAKQKISVNQFVSQAKLYADKGIPFAFSTLGVKPAEIKDALKRAIKAGLPEDVALAALTTNAANIIGMSKTMGTVEPGKIANLILTTKPIFQENAEIKMVFVEGNKYDFELKPVKAARSKDSSVTVAQADVSGLWNWTAIIRGEEMSGTIEIKKTGDKISGSIKQSNTGESRPLTDAEINGNKFNFNISIPTANGDIVINYNAEVEGDKMDGTGQMGSFGTFNFKAYRSKP